MHRIFRPHQQIGTASWPRAVAVALALILPSPALAAPAARDTVSRAAVLARLDSLQRQLDSIGREIATLRARLDSGSRAVHPLTAAAAPADLATVPIAFATRTKTHGCKGKLGRPEVACTPGKLMTSDVDRICNERTSDRRNVSNALKKEAAAAYGVSLPAPAGTIEIDHFIPLALGGDNAIENLWPEPATPKPGFHEKDRVEVNLQKRVCDGEIDLDEAVRIITTDWVKYWKQLPPTS